MDFNGHMRNTAYLDAAADVRMMFFAEHGFPAGEFVRRRIGPVILRDELDYWRELKLLDPVDVELLADGGSADGSHFRLRNDFVTPEGKRVARVISVGGRIDHGARRLVAPPPELMELLRSIRQSDDFTELDSRLRGRGDG